MAEGYAKTIGKDVFNAWSAGSKPSGQVNRTAIAMMKEDGVDISAHTSKSLKDLPQVSWDYIVTMGCGDACPTLPAKNRLDWALPDPNIYHLRASEKSGTISKPGSPSLSWRINDIIVLRTLCEQPP
jgi:protein-tyrosine-phosphatase